MLLVKKSDIGLISGQCRTDPLHGTGSIFFGQLKAGGGVALQHGGQHRGAGAGERIEDAASRLGDLHDVPHELQGLFGQMDAVLRVTVLKYPRQARYGPIDGHIPIGTPGDVLSLGPKAALLGPGVALIPYGGATPDPACPLDGIRHAGELPPIYEYA